MPRGPEREPVSVGRERYRLRGSESELLAIVGAFRVVPESELPRAGDDKPQGPDSQPSSISADVRSLTDQGLLQSRTVVINQRPERVVALTPAGRTLLESRRTSPGERDREQQFYSGLVKPRELAHDAQLYRMFETERARLEDTGARVKGVILDYELKREYHEFVHQQRQAGVDASEARQAFAEARDLPFNRGHIQFPDVRIEYETPEGLDAHRDLELATEHYSRSQMSGKASASFTVYRAAGPSAAGSNASGGTPTNPRHLERWLE